MSKVRSTARATDGCLSPAQFEPQEAVGLGQLLVKQQGRGIVEAGFPMLAATGSAQGASVLGRGLSSTDEVAKEST
jgi:hypothetical protein